MNKQEQEAERLGLTLLRKADKSFGKSYPNYNLYLFKSCGHEQYLQPTHVRRDSVVCKQCRELQLHKEASDSGLLYVGLADNNDSYFRKYRFVSCGHENDMRISNVQKRLSDNCVVCYEDRLIKDAESQNLTYLGKSELNGTYRRYRFNDCSHIKDISAPCVPVGRFECKDCIEDEKVKLCEENGLEVLSKEERYWLFKLPCGHSKKLRVDHAIDDSWQCSECGDSHYTKPSLIYLCHFSCSDFEWLKLGYSRNLSIRKANYKIPKDCKSELLFSKAFDTGYNAMLTERSIHKKFNHLKLCKKFMTGYMQSNGHTECYPVTALEHILKELNEQ